MRRDANHGVADVDDGGDAPDVAGDPPDVADARVDDVATDADVDAPDDPPVDLDHFEGLRRNRVVNDPVVLFELFRRGVYWVPMSDGACARLRLHADERGRRLVTAGGYTAEVVVQASTHRRGQPAEFTVSDPRYRVFGSFPTGDRGVLMFLVGDRLGIRYRLTWDGTSLAVTEPNSVSGNAVVRMHPNRGTCLAEAAEFRASGIAP